MHVCIWLVHPILNKIYIEFDYVTVCTLIFMGYIFCRFSTFVNFAFLISQMLYTVVFKYFR